MQIFRYVVIYELLTSGQLLPAPFLKPLKLQMFIQASLTLKTNKEKKWLHPVYIQAPGMVSFYSLLPAVAVFHD
jgi:hypothetical protein